MATVHSVIAEARKLRTNPFDDLQLANWLWDYERKITVEVFEEADPGDYDDDTVGDTTLHIIGTYAKVYLDYLISQIDYYLQEYDSYNNSVVVFNKTEADFLAAYIRANQPTAIYFKNV